MGIKSHNGVLNPMARTMHQPALASQIENAPPNAEPATAIHQKVPSRIPRSTVAASKAEPITAIIPNLNLAAFPFASILHSILSPIILCKFWLVVSCS